MIKELDYLHYHTTLITDSDDICFIRGHLYEVKFLTSDERLELMNECNYKHRFSIDKRNEAYYKQWFYSREEQLKILLDD